MIRRLLVLLLCSTVITAVGSQLALRSGKCGPNQLTPEDVVKRKKNSCVKMTEKMDPDWN